MRAKRVGSFVPGLRPYTWIRVCVLYPAMSVVENATTRQAAQGDTLSLEESPPAKAPARKSAKKTPPPKDRDMGEALRSVYDRAVQEAVPDEMLDLLSKLD